MIKLFQAVKWAPSVFPLHAFGREPEKRGCRGPHMNSHDVQGDGPLVHTIYHLQHNKDAVCKFNCFGWDYLMLMTIFSYVYDYSLILDIQYYA